MRKEKRRLMVLQRRQLRLNLPHTYAQPHGASWIVAPVAAARPCCNISRRWGCRGLCPPAAHAKKPTRKALYPASADWKCSSPAAGAVAPVVSAEHRGATKAASHPGHEAPASSHRWPDPGEQAQVTDDGASQQTRLPCHLLGKCPVVGRKEVVNIEGAPQQISRFFPN